MTDNMEDQIYYLSHLGRDEQWGLVCTNTGKRRLREKRSNTVRKCAPEEYQLTYITEGQGYFESGSCPPRKIAEGDMIIVFPGENYACYPAEGSTISETWVGFRGDEHLDKMVGTFFDRKCPVMSIGSSDTVFDIYGRLMSLAKSEKAGSQAAMGGFIYALLGYIYYKVASMSVSRIKNIDKIQRAQQMLREEITSHLSPAEIASRLGMSYSLLREQFKATTGMSMAEYVLAQRMNHARTLLLSSDKSIKEIAFEAGYESTARFCCAFKQACGLTASEFRKRTGRQI